jgi:hypothetical protein
MGCRVRLSAGFRPYFPVLPRIAGKKDRGHCPGIRPAAQKKGADSAERCLRRGERVEAKLAPPHYRSIPNKRRRRGQAIPLADLGLARHEDYTLFLGRLSP